MKRRNFQEKENALQNAEVDDEAFVKWYLGKFRLDLENDMAQYEKYCNALDAADPRKLKPAVTMLTAKGRPSYKQISLADFYGIKYQAHSAISDVKALIKIYLML